MKNTSKYGAAFGRYWPQDEAGYLINDTRWQKVPPRVQEIAESLIAYLKAHFATDIAAIYLRGSAAWGMVTPGVSDLDFFVITKQPNFRWESPKSIRPFLQDLIHQYNIEIECPFASQPLEDKDWMALRPYLSANIKCLSLLLAGENFADKIPLFRPGKFLRPNLRWYREDWADFKKSEVAISEIKAMAKLSLRCAYGLVMDRKGMYTNSLGYCLSGFLEYYPEMSEAGEAVLQTYLSPELYEIKRELLFEFWEWLANEILINQA